MACLQSLLLPIYYHRSKCDHRPMDQTSAKRSSLLYFTSIILLYRPFRTSRFCQDASRKASKSVESLLLLYEDTFGFTRVTYLMAYCIYTAATIVVEDLKEGYPGARERTSFFLRALEGARTSCPGIQRSIDVIKSHLPPVFDTDPSLNRGRFPELQTDPSMPAFPYHPSGTPSQVDYDALSIDRNYFSSVLYSFP